MARSTLIVQHIIKSVKPTSVQQVSIKRLAVFQSQILHLAASIFFFSLVDFRIAVNFHIFPADFSCTLYNTRAKFRDLRIDEIYEIELSVVKPLNAAK